MPSSAEIGAALRGFFRLSKDAYVSQSYYESVKDTNFCFFDMEFNDNDF